MGKVVSKKYLFHFFILFLFLFMLLIFGPAELYFANVAELAFLYGEFAGYLAAAAIGAAAIGAFLISLLTEKLSKLVLSAVFGASIAGYLQIMFLNRQLDLLGENPEGYRTDWQVAIPNLIIWVTVIAAVIIVAYYKAAVWKKLLIYMSAFLLAVQGVALVSLLLTADERAYHRQEGIWHLTGEDQFVVSADKNVIVFVLDYYSNSYIEKTQKIYPDMIDFLQDFTYYTNTNADYFGTFPSMISTFADVDLDPSIPSNEWCYQSWTNEKTLGYYKELQELGYTCNMYTPEEEHLCCENDRKILQGIFSNVIDSSREVDIFYKLLFKTMIKMSCYRMAPELAKPLFYTDASEYTDIVGYNESEILYNNYEFYAKLEETGLSTDDESNYFIVQHLSGGHEFTNDAECRYQEQSALEDTYMGAMVLVEEYLDQLKELGVYDDATIIITSDHGDSYNAQVIFFVKEAGETSDKMKTTNAPITLRELMPTIEKAVGAEYEEYGLTIYDFAEDEKRERSVWIREWDDRYNTSITNMDGTRKGNCNIYKVYTYTGDLDDLKHEIDNEKYEIKPMYDSFY